MISEPAGGPADFNALLGAIVYVLDDLLARAYLNAADPVQAASNHRAFLRDGLGDMQPSNSLRLDADIAGTVDLIAERAGRLAERVLELRQAERASPMADDSGLPYVAAVDLFTAPPMTRFLLSYYDVSLQFAGSVILDASDELQARLFVAAALGGSACCGSKVLDAAIARHVPPEALGRRLDRGETEEILRLIGGASAEPYPGKGPTASEGDVS